MRPWTQAQALPGVRGSPERLLEVWCIPGQHAQAACLPWLLECGGRAGCCARGGRPGEGLLGSPCASGWEPTLSGSEPLGMLEGTGPCSGVSFSRRPTDARFQGLFAAQMPTFCQLCCENMSSNPASLSHCCVGCSWHLTSQPQFLSCWKAAQCSRDIGGMRTMMTAKQGGKFLFK